MYSLDDLKTDSNIKTYLDHLGMCTAEELSMYSTKVFFIFNGLILFD